MASADFGGVGESGACPQAGSDTEANKPRTHAGRMMDGLKFMLGLVGLGLMLSCSWVGVARETGFLDMLE